MWEIASVSVQNKKTIEAHLREDYEPFAVVSTNYGENIWFRKEVENEVHSDKSAGSKSRRVRKAPAKSKAEDSS